MDLQKTRQDLEAYADWCRSQTTKGDLVMACAGCGGDMLVTDRREKNGATDWLQFTCQACGRRVEA